MFFTGKKTRVTRLILAQQMSDLKTHQLRLIVLLIPKNDYQLQTVVCLTELKTLEAQDH